MDRQARLKVINYWNWLLLQCISVLGNQVPDIPAFLIPVRVGNIYYAFYVQDFAFYQTYVIINQSILAVKYIIFQNIFWCALTCIKQRPIVWHQMRGQSPQDLKRDSGRQLWLLISDQSLTIFGAWVWFLGCCGGFLCWRFHSMLFFRALLHRWHDLDQIKSNKISVAIQNIPWSLNQIF